MSQREIIPLSTRLIYKNRWLRLREDRIRRRDGSVGLYSVLERAPFAVIAPVENGRVWLVEQYRYPVNGRFWEFPQGTWEQMPSVDPESLAKGELQEETGLEAKTLVNAGALFQAPGYSCQSGHVFLATGLSLVGRRPEPEEQDMICKDFALSEFEAMLCENIIRDATTLAAFGLLRAKGMI